MCLRHERGTQLDNTECVIELSPPFPLKWPGPPGEKLVDEALEKLIKAAEGK